MKLSDFLTEVGHPVAYYPSLARALGGVKQAVLLCQLIYWTGRGSKQDGWVYKTQEELLNETGLSFDEQRTARKSLIKAKVLEERYARLEHRMYFRINTEILDELWENFRIWGCPFPEMENPQFGKKVMPISGARKAQIGEALNGNFDNKDAENTSKNKTEREAERFARVAENSQFETSVYSSSDNEPIEDLFKD